MTSYDFPVDDGAETEPLHRRPYRWHADSAYRRARLKLLDSGISCCQKLRVGNSLDLIDARLVQFQLSDYFSRIQPEQALRGISALRYRTGSNQFP